MRASKDIAFSSLSMKVPFEKLATSPYSTFHTYYGQITHAATSVMNYHQCCVLRECMYARAMREMLDTWAGTEHEFIHKEKPKCKKMTMSSKKMAHHQLNTLSLAYAREQSRQELYNHKVFLYQVRTVSRQEWAWKGWQRALLINVEFFESFEWNWIVNRSNGVN